mgnify:CR=1 FL=1
MSELTESIDAEIESKWRTLLTETQDDYLAQNGIYAQTRWSHVNAPEDGAEVLPDNLSDKPSDQAVCADGSGARNGGTHATINQFRPAH